MGELPVVVCLSFGRRNIADWLQQAVVIEPSHPFQGRRYQVLPFAPSPARDCVASKDLTPARPSDNNWIENQIRPIAIGWKNWLFAGSLGAGRRAAAIMSLIQSARLNGLEPLAYLTDVLTRPPAHPNKRIGEFLPHRWNAESDAGQ